MGQDYIPTNDNDFQAWMTNLIVYAGAHLVDLDVTAPQLAAVTDPNETFNAALQDFIAKQAAAQAARQVKDDARAAVESAARAFVGRLQKSAAVDDGERQALGIPVHDTTPTPAAIPTTHPILVAGTADRLQHELGIANSGTPSTEAKPKGVTGAEIYMAIAAAGAAVPPLDQFAMVDFATRAKHIIHHNAADTGKTAHYIARWRSPAGKGPWSETVSATIAG